MRIINAPCYMCETCGNILEYTGEVYKCKDCGKEICVDCAGFESEYCWSCNENHVVE
jgi:hypothetical protein